MTATDFRRGTLLSDTTIIVTGAGGGIGAAFAEALAAQGASVGVADLRLDTARAVADRILSAGGRAIAVEADVTDEWSITAMFDSVEEHFGAVSVLFNNAGVSLKTPFLETTEEQWQFVSRVNTVGPLLCTQEAARRFTARGGGKIINTCSTSSRQASADFSAYAASKAAVLSLTHSSARALAPHGITVNGIGPGIIETRLWDEMARDDHGAVTAGGAAPTLDDYTSGILLGRVGTPQDVAPTAVFLASDGSDYITGQLLMVDGGIIVQ